MVLKYALNKIQSLDDVEVIHSVVNSVNSNQLKNKRWLLKHLRPYLDIYTDPKIVVAAGWYGLAAHLIDRNVVSFDANPQCADMKLFPNVNYKTCLIEDFNPAKFDVIICTSCEHISDDVLNNFLAKKNWNTLVVLQSNNYYSIPEHINCKQSCEDFANSVQLDVRKKLTLKCDKYDRFMLFAL